MKKQELVVYLKGIKQFDKGPISLANVQKSLWSSICMRHCQHVNGSGTRLSTTRNENLNVSAGGETGLISHYFKIDK